MKNRLYLPPVLLVCLILVLISACTNHQYDEAWIIGKTSAEIEEQYGRFDRLGKHYGEDGLLHRTRAGYIIKESRVTALGKTTEELFVIHFDQDGIATSCEVAPGNWGG